MIKAERYLKENSTRGAIAPEEAKCLHNLVYGMKLKECIEIGVAKGGSALAIAEAVSKIGGKLTGIDPCQTDEHKNAAIHLVESKGFGSIFSVITQPTHLAAPELLKSGAGKYDFAFVDGMHSFEFKSLDAFYCDRLLKIGGYLALHDLHFASTKKVWRLLKSTGRFKLISTPDLRPNYFERLRKIVASGLKCKSYFWYWPNHATNLLVLEKVSDEEVPWNYFKNF